MLFVLGRLISTRPPRQQPALPGHIAQDLNRGPLSRRPDNNTRESSSPHKVLRALPHILCSGLLCRSCHGLSWRKTVRPDVAPDAKNRRVVPSFCSGGVDAWFRQINPRFYRVVSLAPVADDAPLQVLREASLVLDCLFSSTQILIHKALPHRFHRFHRLRQIKLSSLTITRSDHCIKKLCQNQWQYLFPPVIFRAEFSCRSRTTYLPPSPWPNSLRD